MRVVLWSAMRARTQVSHAWGSTWLSLAVSMRVWAMALALPPPSDPANVQFLRPKATGLTARSVVLLSVSKKPLSRSDRAFLSLLSA